MADVGLDSEGDLLIVDDELLLVEDDDAIVQNLTIRLRFFLGEWFLDTRIGIPYFADVFIKNPDLVLVRGLMRRTILTTPGVQSMETFTTDFDNATRKLSVSFKVRKTEDGQILDFSEEFILG